MTPTQQKIEITLTRGSETLTLTHEGSITRVTCSDASRNGIVITQKESAFIAFCNTAATLLGYKIEGKGGER